MNTGELSIYLDNAATTRVDDAVVEAMVTVMREDFGNPSSAHRLGIAAARRLEEARAELARALGAEARDVYFTSGGTEANTIAVRGVAERSRGRHLVVSAIEHPSVLDLARRLGEQGFEVTEVAPDANGVIDVEALERAVRPETAVVTLMMVSNELGTVQPVFEAARRVKQVAPRAHFHVDAVQALGKLPLRVGAGPIDSLAVSAHKIHGPKGAGALWLRRGAAVTPLAVGGGQEQGVRPGTQGMPGIVGLGRAATLAVAALPGAREHLTALRERLLAGVGRVMPTVRPTVDPANAAPHIVSLGFPGVAAEPLLHALEAHGVYVSAGSACAARDKRPSHVLRAVGVPDDVGVLRFSFSRHTTAAEIDQALAALTQALRDL
ncbi:MAG TPA: cysteine desulfurase family protein [Polyangia bacterium]|jgi:cysteine desulfurase|nr:cysteine desulfurase family protein [Polyangia bacterium]